MTVKSMLLGSSGIAVASATARKALASAKILRFLSLRNKKVVLVLNNFV